MEEKIKQLAEARSRLNEAEEILQGKTTAFNKTNAALIGSIMNTKNDIDLLESEIKEEAILYYKDHPESKSLAYGITIQERKQYEYDEAKAFQWAIEHKLCIIPAKLDKTAFNKAIGIHDIPFVEEKTKTIATIPKKLEVD